MSAPRSFGIEFASLLHAAYKRATKLAMIDTSRSAVRRLPNLVRLLLGAWLLVTFGTPLRAQIIFDVFVGHGLGVADSTVAESAWFPVTCEIQNDGPSFNGLVEITGGQFGNGQARRIAIELPTGTKKRFSVPLYCTSRHRVTVDATLFNEKGTKIIAERKGVDARAVVDWQSPLLASLSRTHGGAAALPEGGNKSSPLKPATTHLSPDFFPDNPLALESIALLYLHSARAVELKEAQLNALFAWVHGGGHLVLAVEQPGDVKAVGKLQSFLPCTLGEVSARTEHSALQQWLNNTRGNESVLRPRLAKGNNQTPTVPNPFVTLAADEAFESADLPVVNATLRDGRVLIGTADAPLAIQASRGRGQITVLLFSPELDPVRTWKNRNWLWAKLADVPHEFFANVNMANSGSLSLDGIFGAMVDSKQIRKLPIGWLLLLLLAYLVVIGPLDQYWLKKINKQMLTWITFPTYVVLFSLLIYFIGYKLRSGEMEWNELHVVDVTPRPGGADWRGRTYCSAYSPMNARYNVASDTGFSTLRGEVGQGGAQEVSKALVEQRGNGFAAQLQVPVWTSQLFVNDWWKQGNTPLNVTVTQRGDSYDVRLENTSGKKIPQARLIIDGRMYDLGDITQGGPRLIKSQSGTLLNAFVQVNVSRLSNAVQQRQQQFGSSQGERLDDNFIAITAASFLATAVVTADQNQPWNQNQYWSRFVTPPGFDLTPLMQRGDAILLAWLPDETVVPTLNKFNPRYSKKDTVLRVVVPIEK